MSFVLNPQFETDSVFLLDLPLSQVRLSDNAAFPWVILIPRVAGVSEIIDLDEPQRQQLLTEIVLASEVMQSLYGADKLNVANLGNVVAQLHVHVIARFRADRAWPGPVWNSGQRADYKDIGMEAAKITAAFAERL